MVFTHGRAQGGSMFYTGYSKKLEFFENSSGVEVGFLMKTNTDHTTLNYIVMNDVASETVQFYNSHHLSTSGSGQSLVLTYSSSEGSLADNNYRIFKIDDSDGSEIGNPRYMYGTNAPEQLSKFGSMSLN